MSKKVTKDDIEKIEKSATNLFHLLRHYPKLDPSYTDVLIGRKYEYYDYNVGKYVPSSITEKEISEAYLTQGSKFFPQMDWIETPDKLFDVIKQAALVRVAHDDLIWIDGEEYRKVEFTLEYKDDIGCLGVIDIDMLTDEEKKKVRRVKRGGEEVMINVVNGIKKIYTRRLAVGIYERYDTGKLYVTAYPGEIGGPSLPSAGQSKKDREISEDYWLKKAFVV